MANKNIKTTIITFAFLIGIVVDSSTLVSAQWTASETPQTVCFIRKDGGVTVYSGVDYRTNYGTGQGMNAHDIVGAGFITQFYLEPTKKRKKSYEVSLKMRTGEIVAAMGAIRRATFAAEFGAELERIPDEKLPPGLKPVKSDSLFVPYQRFEFAGWSNISGVQARMVAFNSPIDDKKATATLAYIRMLGPKNQGAPKRLRAVVKEGDIVLFCDYAHEVRGIVPMNEKTKVTGWVELGPRHYTEAELMEKKTPFVRPTEVPDDASWK